MAQSFHLRVPATTANLGAGFDVLGMSLHLFNSFKISPGPRNQIITSGVTGVPTDERNIFFHAYRAVFRRVRAKVIPISVEAKVEIPLARGLGSSAATYLAGAVAAQHVLGYPLPEDELMALATELEGHPDNIVPAFCGGMAVIVRDGAAVRCWHHHVHGLTAVLAIPDFKRSTAAARKVIPARVPLGDAVFNVGRAALFVGAVADRNYNMLRYAMEDALHQRYRARRIPGLYDVVRAAVNAGACGAALSGSGPTMIALCDHNPQPVAMAMQRAFTRRGVTSRCLTVAIDNHGVRVRG
ncbi:MAG TPA: homoserine kinase [bacterium]|nr:homoserine kinase [bacterium]